MKGRSIAFSIEALSIGGAEQMLVILANAFARRGWSVHMICLTEAGELAANLDDAVTLHVLDKQPGVDLALPGKLRRCLREINPVSVNSHLWVANLWTRVALLGTSIPVVVTEHSRDSWKSTAYRWIDRLLASRTRSLIAVSADTADFYTSTVGIPAGKVCVINNGVDTARYASGQGDTLHQTWSQDGGVLLGTVGRLVTAKNHLRLLDMMVLVLQQHPQSRLVIVGDGPERKAIEAGIAARGLQSQVLLAGSRTDIPDVLASLDVFILSSDREGHPLTALEAQAAGTPVVLTDAGGSADALAIAGEERGGLLVEKTAEALAEAVSQLIANPQLRLAMAAFARTHALAHFDREQMVERYAAALTD